MKKVREVRCNVFTFVEWDTGIVSVTDGLASLIFYPDERDGLRSFLAPQATAPAYHFLGADAEETN